jgi:hypothetical protein
MDKSVENIPRIRLIMDISGVFPEIFAKIRHRAGKNRASHKMAQL